MELSKITSVDEKRSILIYISLLFRQIIAIIILKSASGATSPNLDQNILIFHFKTRTLDNLNEFIFSYYTFVQNIMDSYAGLVGLLLDAILVAVMKQGTWVLP